MVRRISATVVTSCSIETQALVAERAHALVLGACPQVVLRCLLHDELADLLGDAQQLVDADPFRVAGVRAEVAAGAVPERVLRGPAPTLVQRNLVRVGRVRLAAGRADPSHEALRDERDDRRRDQERLDAHVDEAVQCRGRVGRVQRREHEVAGERGLHRDARGLDVADLAHEDDVGVLAQDRLQARRRT